MSFDTRIVLQVIQVTSISCEKYHKNMDTSNTLWNQCQQCILIPTQRQCTKKNIWVIAMEHMKLWIAQDYLLLERDWKDVKHVTFRVLSESASN